MLGLLGESAEGEADGHALMAAYARLYDEKGGAVEIEIKESK